MWYGCAQPAWSLLIYPIAGRNFQASCPFLLFQSYIPCATLQLLPCVFTDVPSDGRVNLSPDCVTTCEVVSAHEQAVKRGDHPWTRSALVFG